MGGGVAKTVASKSRSFSHWLLILSLKLFGKITVKVFLPVYGSYSVGPGKQILLVMLCILLSLQVSGWHFAL